MILRVPDPQLTKPNKIVYGGQTLIDLTEDTVTPETLKQGVTAHDAAGEIITGTLVPSGGVVQESDINFYDYDGTLLHSWTLAELAAKTALPELPTREGLVCQGWNWTLAELKATGRIMDVGPMYITNDGATRLRITLLDGRLSPKVGLALNGSAVIDWGDGSASTTLTGTDTSTVVYTNAHTYPSAGDYVISITVTGAAVVLGANSASTLLTGEGDLATAYLLALTEFNQGSNLTFGASALQGCTRMRAISLSSAGNLATNQFTDCFLVRFLAVPSGIQRFESCFGSANLRALSLPPSVKAIGGYAITGANALARVSLPDGLTTIDGGGIYGGMGLSEISVGVNLDTISADGFYGARSVRAIKFNAKIRRIGARAFQNCVSMEIADFTASTSVPQLLGANAFTGCHASLEIRVPASLVDAWKAATNWATYADHIVGVSAT